MLSIIPMPPERIPAYLRGFFDWYAQALADSGLGDVDELHRQVRAQVDSGLDDNGIPVGSNIFDIHSETHGANVGVVWIGGMNLGFGTFLYVHDLRIHAPYRREGLAQQALRDLHDLACTQGELKGLAGSALLANPGSSEVCMAAGLVPLSTVFIRPFGAAPGTSRDEQPASMSDL